MARVGAVAQQGAQDAAVRGEVIEFHLNDGAETVFEALHVYQGGFQFGLHVFAGALVEVHDDGIFGRVIVIGRASGHAGFLGDIAHGGGVEALLAEQFQGGIQDASGGFFRFGHIFECVQK